MKDTPQNDKTMSNPKQYNTEPMQTASDFKKWYVANSNIVETAQADLKRIAAERALRELQHGVQCGLSIQDAADRYIRKIKRWPGVFAEVAREVFSQLGWVEAQ